MQSPNWQQILDVLHENGGEIICNDIDQPWKSSVFTEKEDLTPSDLKMGFSQATIGNLITIEDIPESDGGSSSHGKVSLTQKGFDTWRDEREFQDRYRMDRMNLKSQNNFETRQVAIEKSQHELNKDFKQSQEKHQRQQSKLNKNLNILTAILAFSAIIQSITDISQIWSLNALLPSDHQEIYFPSAIFIISISFYIAYRKS